jgi:hypothetical protein
MITFVFSAFLDRNDPALRNSLKNFARCPLKCGLDLIKQDLYRIKFKCGDFDFQIFEQETIRWSQIW